MNLAKEYLRAWNETVDDYEGICGELAGAVQKTADGRGHLLFVEGDIPWRYHMAWLDDNGLVHDAWCERDEPLPVREWLIEMFGERTWVEVSLNSDTIFDGKCEDFEYVYKTKAEPVSCFS